jgi:hypothetical protein
VLLVSVLLQVWRWQALLRDRGVIVPTGALTRLILGAQSLNLVLPGSVGGDAYRAYAVRRQAAGLLPAAGVVLFERYAGFLATVLVALPAVVVGGYLSEAPLAAVALIALFAALTLPLVLASNRRMLQPVERGLRRVAPRRIAAVLGSLVTRLQAALPSAPAILVVITLSAAMKLCVALIIRLLAAGLGLDLGWADVLVFLPLHVAVSALPVTLNGLGVREANMVVFFVQLGLTGEQAASLAFLHLVWLYATGLPGAVFLFCWRPRLPEPGPEGLSESPQKPGWRAASGPERTTRNARG